MVEIRAATERDARAISEVIVRALREVNSAHYTSAVIDRAVRNFTPEAVVKRMIGGFVLVASIDDRIVGAANLNDATIRSVFVSPDRRKQGLGSLLMQRLEAKARGAGVAKLSVPSSVNAQGFYRKHGYLPLRDAWHGGEQTIIMEKILRNTGSPDSGGTVNIFSPRS